MRVITALALVSALATPAAARPAEDFRCGKDQIMLWTDKSKYNADTEAGVPEDERRDFEPAYNLIPNNKKHANDPRYHKRLSNRLFSFDAERNILTYKGKRCHEIPYKLRD